MQNHNQKISRYDLTEGPVIGSLLRLSIPIVMANFLQTAYQLTDTFWVGRLGADEVAALSLAFPIIFLMISIGGGFALSGAILVSQYVGQRNYPMVGKVGLQTLIIIVVLSIALAVLGLVFIPYVIEAMTDNQRINELTVSYLRISFIGLVFSYLYMMFQSLYRGVGDVKTPFYIVLLTVVLNFIIDPFLIMGIGPIPALGVDGAALATVLTQAIAAVLGLYLLAQGKGGIKIDFKNAVIDSTQIKQILSLGLPASAEQSARALGMMVMTFLVASFGKTTLAVYGVGVRVLSFVIIPALGFSMATSALVGQNIGANKIERTKRITRQSLWVIFCALTFSGLLFFIFAEETLRIFIPNEQEVIKEGAYFIRVIALTFGFIGIQQVASGAMRGGGSTLISMLLAIVSLWVVRFPVAYILSKHTILEQRGLYWSFVVSNILGAIIAILIIRRNRWIKIITDPIVTAEKQVLEEAITEEGTGN